MSVYDPIKSLAMALWPPKTDLGDHFQRWSVSISVATMANLTAATVIVAAGLGYMTAVYPGVANEAQLAQQSETINKSLADFRAIMQSVQRGQLDAKLRNIDHALIDDRKAFCQAVIDKNLPAKSFAEQRFRDDYATYYSLSGGQIWRIPDCSELL